MVKRVKKAPVTPEMRRKWLRQVEEEGISPPSIAGDDHYDVRTVRKQIELERQERERREARSVVLRSALEQHYGDLCEFAQRLASEVNNERGSLIMLKEDRIWTALREHLPRSVIWKSLGRWESIREQIEQLQNEMKQSFEEEVTTRAEAKRIEVSEETGVSRGVPDALIFNCKLVANGEAGLLSRTDFKLSDLPEGKTDVQLGAFNLGKVLTSQTTKFLELVKELFSEVTKWDSFLKMEKLYAELKRTKKILGDELAIITLRRVVPGRCRYCPI